MEKTREEVRVSCFVCIGFFLFVCLFLVFCGERNQEFFLGYPGRVSRKSFGIRVWSSVKVLGVKHFGSYWHIGGI